MSYKFLTNDQAAKMLGIRPQTLRKWRMEKKGPAFTLDGRTPKYKESDINDYINRISTVRRFVDDYDMISPLLSPEELSSFLGVELQTLANWRSKGKGPDYIKVGGLVRYPIEYLIAYVEAT